MAEKPGQDELAAGAIKRVRDLYAIADKHLAGRNWLSDGRSVADAYLFVTTRWAKAKDVDLSGMPNLEAHFQRMNADPAVTAALAAEGLQ